MGSLWAVILYKTVNVYYLIILMRYFLRNPSVAHRCGAGGRRKQYDGAEKQVLPLSKPALATAWLFYGVFHWNEYSVRASISPIR